MGWKDIFRSKMVRKSGKKAYSEVTKHAGKLHPVVKMVEVGQAMYEATNITSKADKANDVASQAGKVTKALTNIPKVNVPVGSLCDSVKTLASFSNIATVAGIGANIVLAYQGVQALELIAARLQDISGALDAQTALRAQQKFPSYAYRMIQAGLGQTMDDPVCEHWFFLYHPDTDWHPEFYHLLERGPLGPRFCGYTHQIDTIFLFMLAARKRREAREKKASEKGRAIRPVKFHLLIPAYQPIVIVEQLKIPEEIGDFVMEGRIHNNKNLVWFNLPPEQRHYVSDIGDWTPPPQRWWDWAKEGIGMGEKKPWEGERRLLGDTQKREEGEPTPTAGSDDEHDAQDGQDAQGEEDDPARRRRNRHRATPVDRQYGSRHGRQRRRGTEGDGRQESDAPREASRGRPRREASSQAPSSSRR